MSGSGSGGGRDGASEGDTDRLLTNDEQEEILNDIQKNMEKQNIFFRKSFAIILYVISAIFVFCLLSFMYEPWELIHQQRFEFLVPTKLFTLYYFVSAIVYIISGRVCQVLFTK